jgi:hypothetical protein
LALTAAVINALQSMLVEVEVPEVVTVLDDALDTVVLLVPEVALLTVMIADPSRERSGRHHAGPARHSSAQQLEQVLRHLVRCRFR